MDAVGIYICIYYKIIQIWLEYVRIVLKARRMPCKRFYGVGSIKYRVNRKARRSRLKAF